MLPNVTQGNKDQT